MTENINFARGVPAVEAFPRAEIEACVSALVSNESVPAFQYGPAAGPMRLRTWIAEDVGIDVDRVITGNGSVALFDLYCRTMLKPGDKVIVESPCYDRVLNLLQSYGAVVHSVRLESDGPVWADVTLALQGAAPLFFYMVPDFQNPTGATYSFEKREALIELARKHGFKLIEDAPYRRLRYRGEQIPAFRDLGDDVTIQLNSFSKLLSPALRAAYLIADAPTIARLAIMAENTYVTPGNFALSVAAEWLSRGHLDAQVDRLKKLYGPRLDSMLANLEEILPEERFVRPEGGFFVGVNLFDPLDEAQLRANAKAMGLDLADGESFHLIPPATPFLRLPFCSMEQDVARRGIKILGEIIRSLRANRPFSPISRKPDSGVIT